MRHGHWAIVGLQKVHDNMPSGRDNVSKNMVVRKYCVFTELSCPAQLQSQNVYKSDET